VPRRGRRAGSRRRVDPRAGPRGAGHRSEHRPAGHRHRDPGPQGGDHPRVQDRRRDQPDRRGRGSDGAGGPGAGHARPARDRRHRGPGGERGREGGAGPGPGTAALHRQRLHALAIPGRGNRRQDGAGGLDDRAVQPAVRRHRRARRRRDPQAPGRAGRAGVAGGDDPGAWQPGPWLCGPRRPGRSRRGADLRGRQRPGALRRAPRQDLHRAGHRNRRRGRARHRRLPGGDRAPRRGGRAAGERHGGTGRDPARGGPPHHAGSDRGGARGRRPDRNGVRALGRPGPCRAAERLHRLPLRGSRGDRPRARGRGAGDHRRGGLPARRREGEGAAMKFLDFPVRNYQFTLVVFAMVAALGLASWFAVPKGEDPPLDFPTFTVVAVYPGASPTDLERLVVKPVEDRIHALENIKQIKSNIQDGVATVQVEFEVDQDPERRYDEVVREMNALRPELPAELVRFTIEKATTEDVAIAQLALVSETAPYRVLDSLADRLEDRLSSLTGMRRVERWGVPARRVDVALDLGRLSRLNLPPGLVLHALGGESADLPAGRVEAGARAFDVKSSGSYETLDQVAATVVRSSGGQLIRVRDVADVHWGYADSTYQARYNGKRAVFVSVTEQGNQNVAVVRDRVWAELDRFETELPPDVTLARGFDQAANVSHRLARLGTDFAIAIALVLLTLLPLGLRAASIVMVSIPLSLAIGLTLLRFAGFTVNQLSIVGAVIALGLLVDDSIVVVENITRFLRAGRSRLEAAIEATRQIAVAVLGAPATPALAFVPLFLLPGGPGMYTRSMPVAVIFTVLGSLFVSLTVIPWLASRVLPRHAPEGGNRVLRAVGGVIHRTYAPVLDAALRRPRVALAAAGADAAARYAESVILARPEVRTVFTSVGHDNPRIYYNVVPRRDNPAVGQLFVVMDRFEARRTPALLDSLRATFAAYPAARIELREFENGPPVDAPIAIRVRGPDLDTLRVYAARVEEALRSTPGTQYVDNPVRLDRTDLRVVIDSGQAGLLGVSPLEIHRTLRLGLAGLEGGVLREPDGEARDVVVRLADRPRPSPETLDRIYFASAAGRLPPIRQVVDVRFEAGVPEIRRVDR